MTKKQTVEAIRPQVTDDLLQTNLKDGLNDAEVTLRQSKFGSNELQSAKKLNPFLVYLAQFKDLLVIILLCASVLSYILAIVNGVQTGWNWKDDNYRLLIEFIEPSIILFVVLTNSLVGAVQEIKSEQAINALKKLSPLQAKVIRNKNLITIPSSEITVGDIVLVEAGDVVPADGYLLFSSNLTSIESSLTGESEPTEKDYTVKRDLSLPIAERKFMLYSSSIIANGTGYFIVSEIGQDTELGKISSLVNKQEESLSPLQIKINKLGKIFGYAGLGLFIASILVQIIFQAISKSSFSSTIFWSTTIVNAISLAVAAIPEGLIAFSSIILAIGVQRMAKKRAIVKDLMAVESLGSCAVICSDKTGTLTQNKMTIVNLYASSEEMQTTGWIQDKYLKLIEYGSLCSEANLVKEGGEYKVTGDPTEAAFLYSLEQYSEYKTKNLITEKNPRLMVIPFDSNRKMMTTINKINNKNIVVVKGAPDVLIKHCSSLSDNELKETEEVNERWAMNAYRVLAIASKEISDNELNNLMAMPQDDAQKLLENDLTFNGLVAMIDPPRETAKDAIEMCRHAGIKPVMITGDNINTAKAIATSLGIYQEGDLAITGLELDNISDEDLAKNIDKYSVYARVKPEDKLRIVKAWQARKQVVAMTGDGVNDAPALKVSDIGCAMGITGTEASKQAANMILADDNFATIVSAVKNGRSVYQKIKNVIQNLLITSIAEIILVFLGLFVFKAIFSSGEWKAVMNGKEIYILSATQLLWINLFTHGFPAIALGLQDSKENYMNRRPISKYESIFAGGMGWNTLWQGILVGVLSMVGYYLGALYVLNDSTIPMINKADEILRAGSTMAFLILGITATFNSINLMSKKPIIMSNPLFYWKVYASVIFSLAFLILVAFVKQIALVFNGYENLAHTPVLIAYGLALPLVLIPIYFVYKLIVMAVDKRRAKNNQINTFEMILPPKEAKKAMLRK
ncbi:cation-translocating P-type ATPase [Metamycoplasma neophronis]|uniref:Cation-transporting P-type ATPase n=1 Tax=Metamycoplasma neophronis TaxID=872983 RepID=A0ABY2Z185_9BACT|nr:cation-transporting P-type ATPase [Metamycoplasma neophronis]TPR54303.1 cation-transporting P-type ATPase [Metamycoplasma neophronis]